MTTEPFIKKWLGPALEAMNIAFETDGSIKKNLSSADKKQAIALFKQVIYKHGADEAWPYIKLADLVEEDSIKFNLYYQSIKYEDTIYAYRFLYQTLVRDNTKLIAKYLDDTI